MAHVRRQLRVLAATWLVFQVSWLAALVPRDCCAAHQPAEKSCHESASATQCPMRAADGRPCPLHRGHDRHSAEPAPRAEHTHQSVPIEQHDQTAPSSTDYRFAGVCDGPLSALFALLSNHGILPEPLSAGPSWEGRRVAVAVDVNPVGRFETPDSPPPRA